MKLKLFQKQDLARAALHDGLILSWDTGLGKTWAIFLWALLKVGFTTVMQPDGTKRIVPNKPVLIIAPGDLHQQIREEGWNRFHVQITALDSQETFSRLVCKPGRATAQLTADGRPAIAPGFYITSYSQLTTNGVEPVPDAFKEKDPFALQKRFCLPTGEHIDTQFEAPKAPSPIRLNTRALNAAAKAEPEVKSYDSVCDFYSWRGVTWKDEYHVFNLHPDDSRDDLEQAYQRELDATDSIRDPKLRGRAIARLNEAHDILANLFTKNDCPRFAQLATVQQEFVVRHYCAHQLNLYARQIGFIKNYPIGDEPEGYDPLKPETDTRPQWKIKCVWQPSLADLSYNAFDAVCIDEGVKMKGEETLVGKGVRAMEPKFRLVLTATPVKNRVPDIFRLAWWATGGRTEAHARFPYRDDSEERSKFASTFMVSESNISAIERQRADNGGRSARSTGSESGGRFTKLTAEVCNVHRLWKLLGPIVLRRRKDDCGEDLVPKIRRVVRCEMGTHQHAVYEYHLRAEYTDINDKPATGAKLQALRSAAADASSDHLVDKGLVKGECRCRFSLAEQIEGRNDQGDFVEFRHPAHDKQVPHTFLAQQTPEGWATFSVNGSVCADDSFPDKDKAVARAKTLSDRHRKNPDKKCPRCHGTGDVALPFRSAQSYIPKYASTLTLIQEILARQEQCVVFSAFTDPLDKLSGYLSEAQVRHVKLDGRTSQKRRGELAAAFKRGRDSQGATPVMLAGVECMAEGHSFHLANNVILIAYSWAYDKFIQAINRVHRMTSPKPVNVYVVLCTGTIDGRLESLIGDKGDAAELVLDGRLIGERSEEVDLAELLKIAHKEFDGRSQTIDEAILHAEWPRLRDQLHTAQRAWDTDLPPNSELPTTNRKPMRRTNPIHVSKPIAPSHSLQTSATPRPSTPPPSNDWRARMNAKLRAVRKPDAWSDL